MEKTTKSENYKQECVPVGRIIIDDTVDNLLLNRMILGRVFEVVSAQSGQWALAVLSKFSPPDLILLDMRMEGMSGTNFLVAGTQ